MNRNYCRDKKLESWLNDTQGLLATPIFYKLGFKKRMFYLSQTSEIEKNYKKAKRHIKQLGFTKKELLRMVRIIENTYSPLNEIVLPIISFFSGGILTVIFSELILQSIQGKQITQITSNPIIQLLVLFMLIFLSVSLLFKIRYESLRGKILVLLYEVIDEMETVSKNKRRKSKKKTINR